jgi:hypothetical protein
VAHREQFRENQVFPADAKVNKYKKLAPLEIFANAAFEKNHKFRKGASRPF